MRGARVGTPFAWLRAGGRFGAFGRLVGHVADDRGEVGLHGHFAIDACPATDFGHTARARVIVHSRRSWSPGTTSRPKRHLSNPAKKKIVLPIRLIMPE